MPQIGAIKIIRDRNKSLGTSDVCETPGDEEIKIPGKEEIKKWGKFLIREHFDIN